MDTSLSLQVVELLRQTFKCTLDSQRQAVEQQLDALACDWLNFLQTILSVAVSRPADLAEDLRLSAASFVLAKTRRSEQFTPQIAAASVELIFAALGAAEGPPAELLVEALEQLLQTQDEERSLASEFLPRIEAQLAQQPLTALRLLRALFSTVGGSMLPFVERTCALLVGLAESWSHASPALVTEWGRLAEQLVKYAAAVDAASPLANNARLTEVLGSSIRSRGGTDPLLICSQAEGKARECVLFLLRTVNALFQYLVDNKQSELERVHQTKFTSISGFAAPDVPITRLVGALLTPVLQSLLSFCSSPDVLSRLEQETVAEEVAEALSLLTKACSDSLYASFFLETAEAAVVLLCPVLLLRTHKETEDFEDNPEEYVSLALDVCDGRESMTCKTCAAEFLDVLCSSADGALAFATTFLVQLIDYTVLGSPSGSLANYRALSHQQTATVLRTPDEDRIDVALLALCVLSESINNRKDLRALVVRCLKTHFAAMAQSSSSIIKTRLVLICVKFARTFEAEEAASVASMLEFLVFCLGPQTASKALVIQASEGLSELMRSAQVVVLVEPLLPKVLEMCLSVLPAQTEKSFFEALEEMVKSSADKLQAQLPQLLSALVQKISAEYRQDPRGLSSGSILALMCWNILQVVADNPCFVPSRLAEIEQAVWPLVQLLGSEKLHFEDCICALVGYLVQRSQTVTEMDWKLSEAFPVVQGFSGGSLGSLFFVLNQFIAHSGDALLSRPERLKGFFAMGIEALGACKHAVVNEEERAQGALLLQALVCKYPGALDAEYPRLFLEVFERWTFATKGYFKAKLSETLLCALASSPLKFLTVLRDLPHASGSGLTFAISVIVDSFPGFSYPYDWQVAAIGFRAWTLLDAAEMQAALHQVFLKVFEVLNNALNQKEKKHKKHKAKSEPKLEVVGTAVRIKLSMNVEKTEEKRLQRSVKVMNTPVKDVDEVQCFRETLNDMRVRSPANFAALIGRLGPELRQALVSLLQAKKEAQSLRKVVHAKHQQSS